MKYSFSSFLPSRTTWNAQAEVGNALLTALAAVCVLQRFSHPRRTASNNILILPACLRNGADVTRERPHAPSMNHELHVTCIYSENQQLAGLQVSMFCFFFSIGWRYGRAKKGFYCSALDTERLILCFYLHHIALKCNGHKGATKRSG